MTRVRVGPTIRVRQGEPVVRRFMNGLPQPSTGHRHGIRPENAMDGAPAAENLPLGVAGRGDGSTFEFEACPPGDEGRTAATLRSPPRPLPYCCQGGANSWNPPSL